MRAQNMLDTRQTCLYFTISFINAIPDVVIYVIEAICARDRGNDTVRKCGPLRVHYNGNSLCCFLRSPMRSY